MLKKVIFLDRDGVINQDSAGYVKNWSEFHFIPGSLGALKRLNDADYTVLVITNQSGVNRKLIPQPILDDIHTGMRRAVTAHGGCINDIFFCPHLPDEGCGCRKPKPGMILEAKKRYAVDLSSAHMIGDSAKDMECARNAGCGTAVLVGTGNGKEALKTLQQRKNPPDFVADDLLQAVNWILGKP